MLELIAKEHEPDNAQGDRRDTHAENKKQQYGRPDSACRASIGVSMMTPCFFFTM
jgi:hypothetical protein